MVFCDADMDGILAGMPDRGNAKVETLDLLYNERIFDSTSGKKLLSDAALRSQGK